MVTKLLCIGVTEAVRGLVQARYKTIELDVVATEEDFVARFEEFHDGDFMAILGGKELGQDMFVEIGQIARNQCPNTRNFAIFDGKDGLDKALFLKNGYNEVIVLPVDKELLFDQLDSVLSSSTGDIHFKRIKTLDIAAGTEIDFDTYIFFPLNKKFIKYSKANEKFDEKKSKKLTKHKVGNLHIDQKDMNRFYEYTAENLCKLSDQKNPMSETEKEVKLTEYVRDLFHEIFDSSQVGDFDQGRTMVSSCQKIISNFITNGDSGNWYNNLIRAMSGQTGDYSHASEVSTFAALFGIALQHEAPEDLAMAGFLHDVAINDLPEELRDLDPEAVTEADREMYFSHAKKSVDAIKAKRMVLPEMVEQAILQHHEKYSGLGYPKHLAGDRMCVEAQILSLADQFQYLMEVKEGKKKLTPLEALIEIEGRRAVDPGLIRRVKKLFVEADKSKESDSKEASQVA